MNDTYLASLHECNKIAKNEYEYIRKKIVGIEKELANTKNNLDLTISSYNKSSIESEDINTVLEEISLSAKQSLEEGLVHLKNSFEIKKEFLSNFTVSLFGRTKAGKSTIREALTNGNGDTIGNGSQRTTRDVRAYQWNHLRILDTPGFDAFKGEEDEKIAFSYVDQTDLILFLITSDNIEESEFEKLARLRTQNKPVVILLNVLYDLNHPLYRKKLLNNPRDYVSKQAIKGHIKRLDFLSKKMLNIDNIDIIPIHARAAFESNLSQDETERKQLYTLSNFEYLNRYLTNMIQSEGKLKRVQSFRDDYIFYLENEIESIYRNSYYSLNKTTNFLKRKHFQLNKWFNRFIPSKNYEIENEIKKIFVPLYRIIDSFVDQYIEDDDFGEKWSKEIERHVTTNKIKKIQENIIDDLNSYLNEFYKEFQKDYSVAFKRDNFSPDGAKKGIAGKAIRWGGAAAGTGSTAIGLLIAEGAIANSWNPVGWGLAIVAVGFGIYALFSDNDVQKFNHEKSRIKKKMRDNLEKMERKQRGAIKTWFYKSITRGLRKKIKKDLHNQIEQFDLLKNLFRLEGDNFERYISNENLLLFHKLMEVENTDHVANISKISNIARKQGMLWKIVIENGSIFSSEKSKNSFERKIGEKIHVVNYSHDLCRYLLNCLNLEAKETIHCLANHDDNFAEVGVPKKYVAKVIGKQGVNVRLAEKLLGKTIKIQVV